MLLKWLKKLFEIIFHLSPSNADIKTDSEVTIVKDEKIYWGEPSKDIDNPEWEVKCISPDGIQVTYCKEYGTPISVDCIGLWYSKKLNKYRLTWKDAKFEEIEAVNISSIHAKILNSEVDEKKTDGGK